MQYLVFLMHSGLEATIQDYLKVVLQKLQVRTHTHTYFILLLPPLSKVRNPLKIIFILYLTLYNNHRADVIAGDESNRAGYQRAYERATSALNAAYDYANGEKSLFKPTYTSEPYTYRNTLAGALSYFIGTECLILAEQDGEALVLPDGNEMGTKFEEYGFGIANNGTNVDWADSASYDFKYRVNGRNCETAVGLGRICFEYNLRVNDTETCLSLIVLIKRLRLSKVYQVN